MRSQFGRRRSWLAPLGVGLALIALLPPVGTYARQYVFMEAVQFAVFAVIAPALLVLGAPWRVLRLSRAPRPGASGPADAAPWADRMGMARSRRPGFAPAAVSLLVFIAACIGWRSSPAVSALARYPGLAVLELVTLLAAGTALWLELVESPPFLPRISRPQRATMAAIAMWSIWVLAYVLGFSGAAWFTGYGHAPGHGLSAVADQEIAAGVLWAIPAFSFMPVIFASVIAWLADSEDPDAELRRISAVGSTPARRRTWPRPPRGWQSPSR